VCASCKPGGGVQLFADGAMDGRIVRCGIICSCQLAATSETVNALLISTPSHVRSAIAILDFAFAIFEVFKRIYVYLFC